MEIVLPFLDNLTQNNNRIWFAEHNDEYQVARKRFEEICTHLISEISDFDTNIGKLNAKDCIFRIFRDIRFSYDKTPYKSNFGAFLAFPGGRKSNYGGYYFHIAPHESFIGVGVWSPESATLKKLRQSIYDNYDEFSEIINEEEFKKIFAHNFIEDDKLKRMPLGFPADFPDPEILKLKHYVVSRNLSDEDLLNPKFVTNVVSFAKAAYPLLQFLNYTIDEKEN